MASYVVLIRGINVGKANRIAMGDLRDVLERNGFDDVSTLLATGNVFVTVPDNDANSAAIANRVEQLIADKFGVSARCQTRTLDELNTVIANNPLADVATDGSKYQVLFLSSVLSAPDPPPSNPIEFHSDTIRLGDRVVYQWCPNGVLEAPAVGDYIMKHSDVFVTARNWNTVLKIRDRLAVPGIASAQTQRGEQ